MTSSPSRPSKPNPSISDRLYRLLLLFYPPEFRRAYYHEMMQTFRDCYRDAVCQQGKGGVISLWGLVLFDLDTTVCIEISRELVSSFKRFLFVPFEGMLKYYLME